MTPITVQAKQKPFYRVPNICHAVPSTHLQPHLLTTKGKQEILLSQVGVIQCRNHYYCDTAIPIDKDRSAFFIIIPSLLEVSNMTLKNLL